MKKYIAAFLLLMLVISVPGAQSVKAQSPTITVVNGTKPISSELRTALENYLNSNPPANALYFAPTYFHDEGTSTLVSLAALNLGSPDEAWGMDVHDGDTSPSKVVWIGTVRVYPDGSGELYSTNPSSQGFTSPRLALQMPNIYQAGGGAYLRLPFDRAAMYGPRGVHGAGGYYTTGMLAVDFVGGENLGTNTMSDRIYASDTGTIDYVCDDGQSVAIRTHNSITDDSFVYAHLLPNSNLAVGHTFQKSSVIGTLKHGPFDLICGLADQAAEIYHLHWMFTPSSGTFRVAQYTLDISTGKFSNGTNTIQTGEWLQSTIVPGTGADDPPSYIGRPASFWDNIVNAFVVTVGYVLGLMPDHNSPTLIIKMMFNAISLVFRIVYVFIRGNFNLTSMVIILLFAIGFEIIVSGIYLVFWLLRVVVTILSLIRG